MFRKKASLLEDNLLQTLIAAITQTLARLVNLKTAGFYQQASEEIDAELEKLLGLKADLVRRLSDLHIVEMLTVNEVLDIGRLIYVAELFREDGEIQELQGKSIEGQTSQIRALNLLLEASYASHHKFPTVNQQITRLLATLYNALPEDTLFTVFDYFENRGQFADAERALGQMLEITHQNPEILTEKKNFYERLLEKPDHELNIGNLSRSHILQKIEQI